ncbi:MAG: hypothetical protein Q9166_000460 [cf. Caloplaca sp. 2 TL-2023]
MAAFLQSVRQGFSNRQAGRANGGNANASQQRSQNTSPVTGEQAIPSTSAAGSVSFPSNPSANVEDAFKTGGDSLAPEETKWFFKEAYAKLSVKGNFMPLAANPTYLELGDWLAHQSMCAYLSSQQNRHPIPRLATQSDALLGSGINAFDVILLTESVEQYRLITNFIVAIQDTNHNTNTVICNPTECPTMSAGRHYTYTWLNNERKPIPVPACQYIALVQRWIVGKVQDPVAFPTNSPFGTSAPSFESAYPSALGNDGKKPIPAGPTTLNRTLTELTGRDWVGKAAGFPESFLGDVRTAWRQMFRIYAHLYHAHFIDPFWHVNAQTCSDLNSSFCYFVSVGKLFGLIGDRDLEPMQPLINIWATNGSIPADCANGAFAIAQ